MFQAKLHLVGKKYEEVLRFKVDMLMGMLTFQVSRAVRNANKVSFCEHRAHAVLFIDHSRLTKGGWLSQ